MANELQWTEFNHCEGRDKHGDTRPGPGQGSSDRVPILGHCVAMFSVEFFKHLPLTLIMTLHPIDKFGSPKLPPTLTEV